MSSPPPSPSATNAGDAPASSIPIMGGPDSIDPACDGAGDESGGGSSKLAELTEDEVMSDGVSSESDESSEDEEGEDFLCTFICDLLASLPRSSNQCWNEGICRRVSAGLKKCHWLGKFDVSSKIVEDVLENTDAEQTVMIDIRGRYVDDARRDLMEHLVRYSRIPDVRYLKVIVGCKVHGIGKGKLKLAITEMLEHDKTIEWKAENGGSIISIKLDDKKDYSLLGGDVSERSQPFDQGQEGLGSDGEKEAALSQVVSLVTEADGAVDKSTVEEDFLCTFISDFMFGIPKCANTCWDMEMCKRLDFQNVIDRREMNVNEKNSMTEDTLTIGLQGQSAAGAWDIFTRNLYCYSCMCSPVSAIRYMKVEVGCKVHGVGSGKLKKAIIYVLEMEEDVKWKEECGGTVISIELDGRQYFKFCGEDFEPPRFDDD